MSQITIQDLSFTYEGDHIPVFQHLDLQLDIRWKLGLVGRNGWGKTTLLRLLEGSLSGSGALTRPDRPVYFPRPVDEPERPAREVLMEGIPWEEEWMLLRELNRLGLSSGAAVLLSQRRRADTGRAGQAVLPRGRLPHAGRAYQSPG